MVSIRAPQARGSLGANGVSAEVAFHPEGSLRSSSEPSLAARKDHVFAPSGSDAPKARLEPEAKKVVGVDSPEFRCTQLKNPFNDRVV
jgi:hypothetical protein